MTEFEQQLADALNRLIESARCPDGYAQPSKWEIASHLAPRVAAALNAADTEALLDDPEHSAHVIAALRGPTERTGA